MSVIAFKCPHCGAPIDINPEDAIFNCPSCGQAYTADGKEFVNHYIFPNTINEEMAYEIVRKFIKRKGFLRGIRNYSIVKVNPMLLPFWVVNTYARTHFVGYLKYTVQEGSGKSSHSVTLYKPIEKTFQQNEIDVLLARRASTIFGYNQVKSFIRSNFKNSVPFNKDLLLGEEKKFTYLSGEFSDLRANSLAKTRIFDMHRSRAEKQCTKVFDCMTEIDFLGTFFVHFPIWEIEYIFNEQTYRIAINGYTGKIIKGEIPVTKRYRITFFALGALFYVGGAVLEYLLLPSSFVISIFFSAIIAAIGLLSLQNSFKPLSVKQ